MTAAELLHNLITTLIALAGVATFGVLLFLFTTYVVLPPMLRKQTREIQGNQRRKQ